MLSAVDRLAEQLYIAQSTHKNAPWAVINKRAQTPHRRAAARMLENPAVFVALLKPSEPKVQAHLAAVELARMAPVDDHDRGTPEARAKKRLETEQAAHLNAKREMRTDPIKKLIDDGRLGRHHAYAVQEIRLVFEAISRKGEVTAPNLEREKVDVSPGCYLNPLETMPGKVQRAYSNHYVKWARQAGERRIGRSAHTEYDLVVKIVMHRFGPRQVEDQWGLKRGATATRVLQNSLTDYARIAGWLKPERE